MTEYRHSAHAVYDLKYHLIWCTKYRYKILRGRVAERARDLTRQICQARDVVIVRGAVSPDHIHMLLAAPPVMAPGALLTAPLVSNDAIPCTSRGIEPAEEAAAILDIPVGTAKSRLSYGIAAIRKYVKEKQENEQ